MQHAVATTNLADLLERILDKGVVIAGDIKIKLVDIELLTIEIRLLICSVEKAQELGVDWWRKPELGAQKEQLLLASMTRIEDRLAKMEAASMEA